MSETSGFCTECGAANVAGLKFCGECGNRHGATPSLLAGVGSRPQRRTRALAAGAVFLIVSGGAGIYLTQGGSSAGARLASKQSQAESKPQILPTAGAPSTTVVSAVPPAPTTVPAVTKLVFGRNHQPQGWSGGTDIGLQTWLSRVLGKPTTVDTGPCPSGGTMLLGWTLASGGATTTMAIHVENGAVIGWYAEGARAPVETYSGIRLGQQASVLEKRHPDAELDASSSITYSVDGGSGLGGGFTARFTEDLVASDIEAGYPFCGE